jgi:hypothetical protein
MDPRPVELGVDLEEHSAGHGVVRRKDPCRFGPRWCEGLELGANTGDRGAEIGDIATGSELLTGDEVDDCIKFIGSQTSREHDPILVPHGERAAVLRPVAPADARWRTWPARNTADKSGKVFAMETSAADTALDSEPRQKKRKKRWSDLSPQQQTAIVVGAIAELIMTTVALRDLAGRPASHVRGSKRLWILTFIVQPVGPILYLLRGRREVEGRQWLGWPRSSIT